MTDLLEMKNILRRFTHESLFEATEHLLSELNIQFDREIAEPINVADLYDGPMPQYLTNALQSINETFFIGIVNDLSLQGDRTDENLEAITRMMQRGDKYDGMFIFACDAYPDANLTRTAAAALTRAFNRIACANPVILVIRQGNLLSLATCERLEYSQQWRQGSGERVGKVNILRNINCEEPHRGHLDILTALGDRQFTTFSELYNHWLTTFSNELLTKKFYNELSDWYAWAVQVARFPNDITTEEDDKDYNYEACIRLITRLIFVWFLKQKKLIPEEFFDEDYIRENLIENFNPHDGENLIYNPEKSRYYRLVLQNLFFAMLNCPIVAEGKTTPKNRRFMRDSFQGKNPDYNINNIMRYKKEFAEGGADKFVELANSSVPFLNGGLFDCLDDKSRKMYYDGFSEYPDSLAQLYLPDYLFFGDEVGRSIDLSEWYGDDNRRNVSARGLIDILKRYSFTIEENTPLDQEVSLDPELLGKVFENLLAAFNPETQTSARKQTGSFYTPREIVQYMVDESLVAHLKRICGDELEPKYRDLLSYGTDEVELSEEQRHSIMSAIYNCRVLDPACGSGAFPMGMLQQMVHVLKRIDPSNEMWNKMILDIALEDTRRELEKAASQDEKQIQKIEENRKARLEDIENAFNRRINDPDYARKLYLIEHCIYGVDIQPIATQISKLRFFISLVVDQKPTADAKTNFGIRPLPNLESKFVTANTLIPLDRNRSLFTSTDDIRYYEEMLQELNHRIFLAKRNKDKQELRQKMMNIRRMMAQTLENLEAIGKDGYAQLTEWNMFDQNASASFFDPEWMFGVKDGFDIVIGNPPYINVENLDPQLKQFMFNRYKTCRGRSDIYIAFIERTLSLLLPDASATFIIPFSFTNQNYAEPSRELLVDRYSVDELLDTSNYLVFDNAMVKNITIRFSNKPATNTTICVVDSKEDFVQKNLKKSVVKTENFKMLKGCRLETKGALDLLGIKEKIDDNSFKFGTIYLIAYGVRVNNKYDSSKPKSYYVSDDYMPGFKRFIEGKCIQRYHHSPCGWLNYMPNEHYNPMFPELFENEKLITINVVSERLRFSYDNEHLYNSHTVMNCVNINYLKKSNHRTAIKAIKAGDLIRAGSYSTKFLLGILNSNLTNWYFKKFQSEGLHFYPDDAKNLPIPVASKQQQQSIEALVSRIIDKEGTDTSDLEDMIDLNVYKLYNLTYDDVLVIDPETAITREEFDKFTMD